MEEINNIIRILQKHESDNNRDAIEKHVKNFDVSDAGTIIPALFDVNAIFSAYCIAKQVIAHHANCNQLMAFALGLGGILFQNQEDASVGVIALQNATDKLTSGEQDGLYPVISRHLFKLAHKAYTDKDFAGVMKILALFKAGYPPYRSIFNFSAPLSSIDLAEMGQRGRERAGDKLFLFEGSAVRQHRRVLVAAREYWDGKSTRKHSIGPLLNRSFIAYGWTSTLFNLHYVTNKEIVDGFARLQTKCEQEQTEVLFLDAELFYLSPQGCNFIMLFIISIRRTLPDIKIVSILLDVWCLEKATLRVMSDLFDFTWMLGANDEQIKNRHALKNPLLFFYPSEEPSLQNQILPITQQMSFYGGVNTANYSRIFWLTAISIADLPITIVMSRHQDDELDPLDSYKNFCQNLFESRCAVNFCTRSDLSHIVPGRTFEVMLNQSLLIQEYNPVMDYYFVAGEHYLEFSSFPELASIAQFIKEQPNEAEKIRRQGYAFAKNCYSNDKVIGYLDRYLFNNKKQ